jgi:hypothetical protein
LESPVLRKKLDTGKDAKTATLASLADDFYAESDERIHYFTQNLKKLRKGRSGFTFLCKGSTEK